MPDVPLRVKQAIVITGMLVFGTCTVVIQKVIFNMSGNCSFFYTVSSAFSIPRLTHVYLAVGNPGEAAHKFEKPWFQTEVMFVG